MKKIYIGNLPFRTSEEELEAFFSEFGPILEVILIRDRRTKRLKGFGFVEFETEEAAQKAFEANGKDYHGRPLKISEAKDRVERGDGRRDDRRDR